MSQIITISNEIAHVILDANRLVSNVRCISEHRYQSDFAVNGQHPYLYENPDIANHVSGTTYLDVSRQLMKAILHIYYAVPMDSRFTLQKISIEFFLWGRIGTTLSAVVSVKHPAGKKSAYGHYKFRIEFLDQGQLLGLLICDATALSAEMESKLMSRQFSARNAQQ
jgi:hypothetical protein